MPSWMLNSHKRMAILPLWAPFSSVWWSSRYKIFCLCSDEISCGLICAHCLLPWQWEQLKRVCLPHLHSLPWYVFCDGRWMRCHLAQTPRTHQKEGLCSWALGTFQLSGAIQDSSFIPNFLHVLGEEVWEMKQRGHAFLFHCRAFAAETPGSPLLGPSPSLPSLHTEHFTEQLPQGILYTCTQLDALASPTPLLSLFPDM